MVDYPIPYYHLSIRHSHWTAIQYLPSCTKPSIAKGMFNMNHGFPTLNPFTYRRASNWSASRTILKNNEFSWTKMKAIADKPVYFYGEMVCIVFQASRRPK